MAPPEKHPIAQQVTASRNLYWKVFAGTLMLAGALWYCEYNVTPSFFGIDVRLFTYGLIIMFGVASFVLSGCPGCGYRSKDFFFLDACPSCKAPFK